MLLTLLLALSVADWVPARWYSSDPASLELLKDSPVNCLLLEEPHWSPEFSTRARERNILTLGVVHPGNDALQKGRLAARLGGVVLEGEVDASVGKALADSGVLIIELPYRSSIHFDSKAPVLGTFQGVWPGINLSEGEIKSAPSGAPWIDTNAGFLRFLRAASPKPIWISNLPPGKTVIPVERYLQAIGDAAMSGARWVLAFDEDYRARLLAREERALRGWKRINDLLGFLESHQEWRDYQFGGQMAVIQDAENGALLSGGILDMIVVKHTPVRPVPYAKLGAGSLAGSKMAVNVDPSALSGEQMEAVKAFTSAGGTLLTGPPGWKFPSLRPGQIALDKKDLEKLDTIWREMNAMTGRRNLGARLFNVSSMLSNLLVSADGRGMLLYLVNFSNYPAESVTIHLLGKWRSAMLHTPGAKPRELAVYPVDDGTGVDVEIVNSVAALVIR